MREKEEFEGLSPINVIEIFQKYGAYLQGHFEYTSGRHGKDYLNKYRVYPHTTVVDALCESMARKYIGFGVEVVVAPAYGGIALAHVVASNLSQLEGREILGIYTQKDSQNNQILPHDYDKVVQDRRVLTVEDTMTTGSSVMKVNNSITKAYGEIVGVCALINRDPLHVTAELLGTSLDFLAGVEMESYDPNNGECPMCIAGIPIDPKP